MSIVYVIQEPPLDRNISPAKAYGKIEIVLPPGQVTEDSAENICLKLRERLSDRFTENDYILASGDPSAILLAGLILAELDLEYIQILKWERRTTSYHVVRLHLGDGGTQMLPSGGYIKG